jgi:hypothetical protein
MIDRKNEKIYNRNFVVRGQRSSGRCKGAERDRNREKKSKRREKKEERNG